MAKPISEVLADNLKSLSRERKSDLGSQPRIASVAKVGQRTVGRALKGEGSTTIGSLDRIARAFGLEAWHLLHPDLPRARAHPVPQLTAQQPLPIYDIDQNILAELLEAFDKLHATQRREFLQQMHAAVEANITAAKHMQGRRLSIITEDKAADHLPPAPKHDNGNGT
jgi:transcriptional regulator with XRE-family HTH domain